LDDEAAGWGGGVGLTPWYHVLVPYTPIGRLSRKLSEGTGRRKVYALVIGITVLVYTGVIVGRHILGEIQILNPEGF
jgi:hypothetical protein